MFKSVPKLFRAPQYADPFSREVARALGGAPSPGAAPVTEEEVAELRDRIARLEAVLLSLRSGTLAEQR